MRLDLRKISFINERAIPWIIWSVAGCYYFFEIMLRILPGTMAHHMMETFQITATQFGMFTAFYYWSYTLMQIPAGLIVDRYSIRKTLFFACLMCIFGFVMIHYTTNINIAELGRFTIGFGSSFAYVAALKVASIWLPPKNFGMASCIVDSLGMFGAIFVELAIVRINITYGYATSLHILLILGFLVALLIHCVLRDKPDKDNLLAPKKHIEINLHDKTDIITKLSSIIKNPQIWLIGLVGALFYLPSSVIGDVWGIPYLKHVYHFTDKEASLTLSLFFAGWVIAGPFLGALSDHICKRCGFLIASIGLDALLFSIIIFAPHFSSHLLPHYALFIMFFIIGAATGTHPLVFALAKENYPNKIAGTVVAFTNTLTMVSGIIFQPIVGVLLDYSHHSLHTHAIQHYTSANYTFALSIIPVSLLLSIAVMLFIKETGHSLVAEPPQDDLYIIHKKFHHRKQ